MIYVGCHLSVSDGYAAMGRKIIEFGGLPFILETPNEDAGYIKEIAMVKGWFDGD